jgi:hypothetical protein
VLSFVTQRAGILSLHVQVPAGFRIIEQHCSAAMRENVQSRCGYPAVGAG